MSDLPNDESRLRATEAQMRRALGLGDAPTARHEQPVATQGTGGTPRPPRSFVRDGEVAVTLVQRERSPDGAVNQLDAARQAIRSQAAARENAERQLREARTTIRDLQTKLTHAQLARDEAAQHAERELQAVRAELASELAARQQAEAALATAMQSRPHPVAPPAAAAIEPKPQRRRGRPPKAEEPAAQTEFVEWWKPGWQQKYR